MSRRRRDEEIERTLDGGEDPSFDALADALRAPDAIDPSIAAAHVAAAASLARETPAPVTEPEPAAALPWWRRVLVRGAGLGLTAKLLLGGAVAVAATGGAAAGGILPAPVQGAIADTVSHVGIQIPNPRSTTTTTTVASTTTTAPAPTTTVASGNDDGDDDPVATGTRPGVYRWDGTACEGTELSVRYRVTADGELELVSVVGDPDDIDSDDDRIRVDFDGVEVDIRIDDRTVTVDADRDCEPADDGEDDGDDPDDGDDENEDSADDDGDDDEGNDPDDGDDGNEDSDDDGDDTTDGPTPGNYTWFGTSCAGDPISVSYTVTESGTLVRGSITGDVASVDEDDDDIEVSFTDGIDVDISINGASVVVDEDRDCNDV